MVFISSWQTVLYLLRNEKVSFFLSSVHNRDMSNTSEPTTQSLKIASVSSSLPQLEAALEQLLYDMRQQLGAEPHFLFVFCTATYQIPTLAALLESRLPNTQILGSTSCQGIMTETGFCDGQHYALGMLGIYDPKGCYACGFAELGDNARLAAQTALLEALKAADRLAEAPAMIFMSAAPGSEERVLEGIHDLVGKQVPVMGGSSADQAVKGQWWQFSRGQASQQGVVIAVLFPSVDLLFNFHSGYDPSFNSAIVTQAEGRRLYALDNKPAARVYDLWTHGLIGGKLKDGGNILSSTSLHPLGLVSGQIGPIRLFRLAHPETVLPDGSLTLFSEIHEGDRLWLMTGTPASLISRAGHVARSALGLGDRIQAGDILGALVVYCAGCMLTIRKRMPEVVEELKVVLGNKPFLGLFSFGEQGCFPTGENAHGNLMISVLIFYRSKSI